MRNDGKVTKMYTYVNIWADLHTHTKQLTVSAQPAANKTADQKELQLCRDRHEDFGVAGHQVNTDFVMFRGHSCRKREGVKPV